MIVHLDKGNNLGQYTWMFDGLKQNGAKWDVIGMSLYPDWITDQTWEQVSDDCLDNIKTLSGKYNCDVIISEIGMVWNSENAAPFLKKMVDGCKAISTCEGVFYWELSATAAGTATTREPSTTAASQPQHSMLSSNWVS